MALTPECIAAVKEASGGSMDDSEAKRLIQQMIDKRKLLESQGRTIALDKQLMESVTREVERKQIEAALARKHAVISAVKEQARLTQADTFKKSGLTYEKVALGLDEGVWGVEAGRVSTDSSKLGYHRGWLGQYTGALERDVPGWHKLRRSEAFNDAVVGELTELTKLDGGKPGLTGNKEALAAARVMAAVAKDMRIEQNGLGAYIGEHDGWGGPHWHDGDKVREAGPEAWKQRIKDTHDMGKSFPDAGTPAELDHILSNMWDNIALGKEPDLGRPSGMPQSVAKAASQHRVLIPKDYKNWLAYNKEFGSGHIFEAFNEHIRIASQRAGLMQQWGPNFRATRERVLKQLEAQARRDPNLTPDERRKQGDAVAKGYGSKAAGPIWAALQEAEGTTLNVVNSRLAHAGGNLRAVESMAKLGMSLFSNLGDLVTGASNLTHQGVPVLKAYGSQLEGFVKGRGKGEAREFLYEVGEGMNAFTDNVTTPWGSADGSSMGWMHWLQNKFQWAAGLSYFNDIVKGTQARVTSNWMGRNSGESFGGLSERYRYTLQKHGITDREWDVIRASAYDREDGNRYVNPIHIANLDDAAVRPLAQDRIDALGPKVSPEVQARAVDLARRELTHKVRAMFADEVRAGSIEPNAQTRRILLRGTRPGTPEGELLRSIAQFKSYPVGFLRQVLGRVLFDQPGATRAERVRQAVGSMAQLQAGLLVAGTVAFSAKTLLRGFTLPDFENPKTILAILAQSGGAGMYGDYLFSNVSRFGGDLLHSAAGPVIGAGFDLAELGLKIFHGDAKAADILNKTLQNTPFMNLYMVRPGLDVTILNGLHERLSPGFLARQDEQRRKDYGERRWLDNQRAWSLM